MADNKKIYSIQINGIEQSIKQVDALSDALQFLDKKIKELESRSVSVTSTQSGNGNRNADLQTEDKLLKQIQSTEQQIRDARREDYQSLLAQKDLLKDITDQAKQRAAAERLSVGNYANTMKGMKQELADIKSVMQTTDLESDTFDDLTKRAGELTKKLKELEVAYGQFGRNVGNYPGTMEQGFSKLQIEVNGTIREFDNARQALKELTNERNTLKLMGEDFGNLDEVVKTLKSDIKDMEMSSAAMDNLLDSMQGLIALGSSAEGFAALFGFDNDQIQQTIQKLVALQNILQGIEVIKKQMQTGEGIGGMFAKGNAAIDKFSASLLGVSTNAKAAKKGLTEAAAANVTVTTTSAAATVAVKALSFALKTVGIGIILTAVAFLVEGLQSLIEWFTKADEATERTKKINEEAAKAYGEAKSKITSYTARVKDFNGTKQQEKKLVDELNSQLGKELGTYKTLAEWQKVLTEKGDEYCESMLRQAKAQAALNVVTEAYINLQQVKANIENGEYHHWYQTVAGDREADAEALAEANKQIENAENEYRRIVNESIQFDKTHSLGDFSPQIETTKKSGAKLGKTIKDIEADIAKARVDAMKQGLTKTLAQLELERNKRIAEAKKTGKLVNEQIEQINKTFDQKVFDARVTYHENLIKDEKSFWESILRIQQQAFQSQVEYAKKMNELRLENNISGSTNLENPFEVKALTIDYNSSDVKKYIGGYKQDMVEFYINTKNTIEFIEKALEGLGGKYEDLSQDAKQLYDKYNNILLEARAQLDEIENQNKGIGKFVEENIQIISESMNEAYALRTLWRKKYYEKILEYTKKAADRELEIEEDKLTSELKMERDAENERHKIAISQVYDQTTALGSDKTISSTPNAIQKKYEEKVQSGALEGMKTSEIAKYFEPYRIAMDEWLRDLDTKLKQGEISWDDYIQITGSTALKGYQQAKTDYEEFLDEYNRLSDAEKSVNKERLQELVTILNEEYVKYLEKVEAELETHQNKMKVLENKYKQESLQAERDNLKARQSATTEFYSNLITENENALSSINSKIDKAERRTPLGIINYKATKRELTDLRKTVEQVLGDIAMEKEQLLEKLKKGEISFGDYDVLISQLKTIETQAQETGQNVSKNLQELFSNTMQSISNIAQQLGSSLNTLIGNLGEYADVQYENQINDLQDFIDKYEEKLQEQREITQQHASEVDSIEQELANARGARREHLIDKLNAEMAAQRASLAQEKKMEKEKKKMEEDKKKLEEKRFEEQKKVQTAQAIMSGALAVTNALAVQPFWVGIAMAAMAAAATAVQIATIQSQKYASGGVIEGKSHAQGGVKVLGGRAEVEGGEYITNKVTTSKNVDLLEYINSKKKRINLEDLIEFYGVGSPVKKNIQTVRTKFADGGVVPTLRNDITINDRLLTAFEDYSNRPTVVSVVDIIDRTKTVNDVKVMAGLDA